MPCPVKPVRSYDFTVSSGGWSNALSGYTTTSSLGAGGWVDGDYSNGVHGVYLSINDADYYDSASITFDAEFLGPNTGFRQLSIFYSDSSDNVLNNAYYTFAHGYVATNETRQFVWSSQPAHTKIRVYFATGVNQSGQRGSGVIKSITLNRVDCTPTATPPATSTATPTATSTPPPPPDGVSSLSICPQDPVLEGEVSASYMAQCRHCMASSELQETPDIAVTHFATPTINPTLALTASATPFWALPSATAILRLGTVQPPEMQSGGTATPAPQNEYCYLTTGLCAWTTIKYGHLTGAGLVSDDVSSDSISTVDGYSMRAAGLSVVIPRDNNQPHKIQSITLFYDLVNASYTGDTGYYRAVSIAGIELSSTWFDAGGGVENVLVIEPNGSISGQAIFLPARGVSVVDIVLLSDRALDGVPLEGSVTLSAVQLQSWDDYSERQNPFGEGVACYLPEDYPYNPPPDPDDFLHFAWTGDLEPVADCYTMFPEIDISGVINAISGLTGGSNVDAFGIPRVDVCVFWWDTPSVTFFGVVLPFDLIINAILFALMGRAILRF